MGFNFHPLSNESIVIESFVFLIETARAEISLTFKVVQF